MKKARALLVLAVGLVVAAALAVLAIRQRTPPVTPVEHVPTTWKTAREAPMHVFHVGTKQIACAECHADQDAAPTASVCTKCHEAEVATHHRGGHEAPTTCLTCHAFGAGPAGPSCNDCHAKTKRAAGAPALDHHAGTDLPCGACHDVHAKERAVLADCTACHATTSVAHGRFEARASPDGPGGDAGALPFDPKVLASVRKAAVAAGPFVHRDAGGAPAPAMATAGEVCSTCHAPHASKTAARATCDGCHARTSASPPAARALVTLAQAAAKIDPRGPRVASHEACVTCHDPHRARKAEVRACDGCHADHRGVAAVKGHASCTGCHAPHAPSEARGSCTATCHANVQVLAAPRVAAHAQCTNCHAPHRPDVSAGRACVRCHESTKPTHPPTSSAKGEQSCTGCHAPHGARTGGAIAVAAACSSCHTTAKDDRAFHTKATACASCHAPHAFRLAGAGTTLCARCHGGQVTATTTRPGHASCTACHGEPHAPIAKPACGGCHTDETSSAPKGHAQCTSCHDAHSGSLGTRATCTTCHANKAKALHANVAQGCPSCHRPHALKGAAAAAFHADARPRACGTCHTTPSLPGLHSVAAHGTCASCHTAHAPPRSDRAACTSACHANMREHQPAAQVCKGCHLFGK